MPDQSSPRKHGMPTKSMMMVACRRTQRDLVGCVDIMVDFGGNVFSIGMKVLGPCLVVLALGLIGFCIWTFLFHLIPNIQVSIICKVVLTFFGSIIVFNILYNYAKTVLTSPGIPPEFKEAEDLSKESGTASTVKKCSRCSCSKPVRAHHCSVCRRCVLKMDHHCPWVNNCVGHGNYRYFCLFLLFLALGCIFYCSVIAHFYGMVFLHGRRLAKLVPKSSRQYIVCSFTVAMSILFALFFLGGFHVYLVLTNQTTIEFQLNLARRREYRKSGEYFRNPYDVGRTRNFMAVFGPNPFWSFWWLFPFKSQGPSGDGQQFPTLRGRNL